MSTKKLIISYRQNETHEKLIPLIQSALTNRISKDILVTLIEYPRETIKEAVEDAVSNLYPNLDSGVTYLSDYTSSIPYKSMKEHPYIEASTHNLEEMYRRIFWLKSSYIINYKECKDKSEIELRELADKDITTLATEISAKLNTLDEIKKVELVIDRISHHIRSLSALKRSIGTREWVSYNENPVRYHEIESEVDTEYGKKMFESVKEGSPDKEVVVNEMIDSTWKNLDKNRREYLQSIDLKSNCLIIDGHNWLGDPNYNTEFTFTNALTIDPSGASVWCSMKSDNRNKWENRLITTNNRLSEQQIEALLTEELTKMLSTNEE